jgi:hypothetical protein
LGYQLVSHLFHKSGRQSHFSILAEYVYFEIIENSKSIFIALIDAQKAFDIVWHDGLFREIFKANITGNN